MREQILSPLGMKDTAFSVSKTNATKIMPMHGDPDANKLISFQQAPLKLVDAEKSFFQHQPTLKVLVEMISVCLHLGHHALA